MYRKINAVTGEHYDYKFKIRKIIDYKIIGEKL